MREPYIICCLVATSAAIFLLMIMILKCDMNSYLQVRRLSGADKDKRDLLLYFIWRSDHLRNQQIGSMIGVSYSAVSHSVKSAKAKLKKESKATSKIPPD